jgi:hypothetical protein
VQGDRSTFAVPGANGISSPRPQRYCFSDRPFLTAWAAGLTGAARRSQGPFHSLAAVWGCSERPTMLSAGASAAVRSVAGLRRRSDVRDARTLQPNIYTACSRLSCWQKGGSVGGHVRSCLVDIDASHSGTLWHVGGDVCGVWLLHIANGRRGCSFEWCRRSF